MKCTYLDTECDVVFRRYENKRTAILLFDPFGLPMAKATVNIPQVDIADDEIIINEYDEQESMLKALIEAEIIKDEIRVIHPISSFMKFNVGKLNKP